MTCVLLKCKENSYYVVEVDRVRIAIVESRSSWQIVRLKVVLLVDDVNPAIHN